MKSWQKPTPEAVMRALSLATSETDRVYFFSKLTNPLWLPVLIENGYFHTAPHPQTLGDGNIRFPQWPELRYLNNICAEVPDQVVDVLVGMPPTDNLSVYSDILDIAAATPPDQSIRLAPKAAEFLRLKFRPSLYSLLKVLPVWAGAASFEQLESVLSRLVGFEPDPSMEEKIQRRKDNPEDYFTSLEPRPFMHSHEYKEFIAEVLPVLLKNMPVEMTKLLVKTTGQMIDFKMHPEQKADTAYTDDWSEIWCRRLIDNEESLDRSPELLVQALTLSCMAVYENDPDNIQKLDQLLAKQRWKVFERIRQYLFGKYPVRADLEAVRTYILKCPHYDEYSYGFEFQMMLKSACVQFGSELLTEMQRKQIFDAILSGPSKERFKEWIGDQYTDEKFEQRRSYFQRQQLAPFRTVLFGKYEQRLRELEAEAEEQISDEDYSPVGRSRGGIVTEVSPKPKDELLKLSDTELLEFINNWNDGQRDYGDGLKEINVHGLSIAFQEAFAEVTLKDSKRLEFWVGSLDQITRPVYVKALVAAMQQIIKSGVREFLASYLAFCSKVLNQPQAGEESVFRGDESDACPKDWTSSRRAVCDLVASCLSNGVKVSFDYSEPILGLLEQLCTQPDLNMDRGQSIIISEEQHPFTDAINYARGRAWEQLFEYAAWTRQHDKDADLSPVWGVIRKRAKAESSIPLTLPEYAMLGRCYVHFFILKEESVAEELKPALFPVDNQNAWSVAFTNFLSGSRPHPDFFDWFKDDYVRALSSFGQGFPADWDHLNLIESVGDRLFLYYLWDLIPKDGEDALLKKYYDCTEFDKAYWKKLFHSAGGLFRRTKEPVSAEIMTKVRSFVQWRIDVGCKEELTGITWWLEATCLDQRWLLGAFSEILDLIADQEFELMFTFDALARNTEVCLDKALECLEKITAILIGKYIYFSEEPVKKVLQAGFASEDENILKLAASCRENLLKARRFDFLDVGTDK